ncbi:hypothetical protein [Streptomyces sp. B1I3]|uniref:hypothetical protein n=1 Tax=Streptomyces sp. B1I3 TaxID=3042264 RepID=UPI00278B61BE|nr:hypothetical protein [Streptomyces sp. B1I3]MDQ0793158.1 hypothetical protein [Streptomyces sp. B1I3]
MDQYDSQSRRNPEAAPDRSTPIYDRLLAEWCEAGRNVEQEVPPAPDPERAGAFVPAARRADRADGSR